MLLLIVSAVEFGIGQPEATSTIAVYAFYSLVAGSPYS
jgi:hypothetical protein